MNHTFNIEVAQKYGVDESIMLENIAFWVNKNKANKKHFYDNEYWTYNSTRAFTELFPYWTEKQIQRILKSLENQGLLKTGNYNKVAYDRTKWYGLTEKSKSIYSNGKMEILEKENGITEKVKPIPYINSCINPVINTNTKDIYTEAFNHYLSKDNLIKHKTFSTDMKKSIDLAVSTYKLDLDYLKRIIDRHSEKVELTKNNGQYATRVRTIPQLFGQKIKDSTSLICSVYLDEVYTETSYKTSNKQLTAQEMYSDVEIWEE